MSSRFGGTGLSSIVAAALALGAVAPTSARADDFSPAAPPGIASPTIDRAAFHAGLRRLWEENLAWTRLSIVSVVAGLPGEEVAAEPLRRAEAALGAAIEPFYGETTAERLAELLRLHVLIATELVRATRTGDGDGVEAAATRWYANATALADLLSEANPEHLRETLRAALRRHLDLTRQHAEARLRGDWNADVEAYDTAYHQVREVADALFAGLVARYPDRFH